MTARITAGAFLSCGDKMLMIKRGEHKEPGPGMWAGVGGHLELCDIANPRAINTKNACLREVEEEAGIAAEKIRNLTLKYIAVRKDGNEIRIHHHYFGEVEHEFALPYCDEGELHWVEKSIIPGLPMSPTVREALLHRLKNPNDESFYLVAMAPDGVSATISKI